MSWKTYRFGDFLTRSKIPIDIEDEGEYKRVTIKIKHQGISIRDTEKGKKIGTKKQFILKEGQFVLSKIDARYGAFGIAPYEVDGAIITGNFWAYDVDFSKVNIEWFNQFTNSKDFYDVCERASSGITHRKYLNENFFLNYEIELPEVDEQLEIIEEFKKNKITIEAQSSELSHQLSLVKQLRQAFLREAMQGNLICTDSSRAVQIETGAELLAKIKAEKEKLIAEKKIKKPKPLPPISEDEIPFEIPDNWVWCRLGEIVELKSGNQYKYPKANAGVMFVKVGDMNLLGNEFEIKSSSNYFEQNSVKESDLIKTGSIIFPKRGGAIATNKRRVIKQEPVLVDSNTMAIIPSNLISFEYFLHFFSNVDLSKFGNEGVIPQVNNKDLNPIILSLPPLSEQKRIVAKLDELLAYCDSLEESIKTSQKQNEMLLAQVLREALEPKTEKQVIELAKHQKLEENYFLKRKILACYIINKSADDKQFGGTKFEKLLYLADNHVIKRNFGQKYYQKAAGPYDNKFTKQFFSQVTKANWFCKQSLGNMNRILPGKNNSKSQKIYNYFTNKELSDIDKLIEKFKNFDYEIPEIVSTLYAVWNNRIIRNQAISDELLKKDFLDWDEGKTQYVYPKDRVTPAIKWMKENDFVPNGWGKIIEKPKSKTKKV